MDFGTRHWTGITSAAVCLLLWIALPGGVINEYLANAILGVWFLSAPTLLAAKLRWPTLSWIMLWMAVAPTSWVLLNLALAANPPDNGFGSMVTLMLGWFYLLPVFGVWVGIYWLLSKWLPRMTGGVVARNAFPALVGISTTIWTVAHFMWAPQVKVEAEARRAADVWKLGPVYGLQSHRTWAGWTVDLDLGTKQHYPVFFSRGGKAIGAGGG